MLELPDKNEDDPAEMTSRILTIGIFPAGRLPGSQTAQYRF